jgi:AcrR family transcriptional regulator
MTFMYEALIRRTGTLPMMTCTTYSCQVTSAETTAPAAKLTKAAVVDRALELADAVGLDALTIRKLATELGVTPMALYWHFRSKDELLQGLSERVWSEIDIAVDPAAAWLDQLRGLMESLLRVLRSHSAAPRLLADHTQPSEAMMKVTEVTLGVLRGAGFDPAAASAIARYALWTGLMLVMGEPGAEYLTAGERAEKQRRKQVQFAMLPPDVYPNLVECAIPMTACNDPEQHYELGVTMYLAGAATLAGASPPGRYLARRVAPRAPGGVAGQAEVRAAGRREPGLRPGG